MGLTSAEAVDGGPGAVTAQVFAFFLEEGRIPSMVLGEVHELAVSIDDWTVKEIHDDRVERLTVDEDDWVEARGILRRRATPGPEDGRSSISIRGQTFVLLGSSANQPPVDRWVSVGGILYVEPTAMPLFGWPNPMALPTRRRWRVVGLRRVLIGEVVQGPRTTLLDRLPEPADVHLGSYYYADLVVA